MLDEATLVQIEVAQAQGERHLFVTTSGTVIRDVSQVVVERGKDGIGGQILGEVDNPTEINSTCSKVRRFLPFEDCLYWSVDPRWKELPHFIIKIHEADRKGWIIQASWDVTLGKLGTTAYARTVADAIRYMREGSHPNPPDCICEHAHCSFRGCHSIVPSSGAFSEADREFPVTPRTPEDG